MQSRNSPFANRSQKSELEGTLDRDLNSKENVYIRGLSEEELLEDNVEGLNNRNLRQRLFEDDRGHIFKFLDGLFEEKIFRKPVVKFISKLFKHRLSVHELSHILYGCVTFEIEWSNVRGINYVNELQVYAVTVSMLYRHRHLKYKCVHFFIPNCKMNTQELEIKLGEYGCNKVPPTNSPAFVSRVHHLISIAF